MIWNDTKRDAAASFIRRRDGSRISKALKRQFASSAHQPHFGHTPFFDTTVVAIAEHLPASCDESDHRAGRMPDRNLAVVVFVITRQARRIRGNKKKGPAKPAAIIAGNILFALFCWK
jgi:hypothetical protein